MNEKTKILEMLKEGKINVDEAERLINAISSNKSNTEKKQAEVAIINPKNKGKNIKGKLKIIVESADGDNVRISIPLKLAYAIDKMMPKKVYADMQEEGIDLKAILANISDITDELDEDIVNVDSADGDKVRVFIERD